MAFDPNEPRAAERPAPRGGDRDDFLEHVFSHPYAREAVRRYSLEQGGSREAIGHNIATEEAAGKKKSQAIAIALHTAGVPRK